MKPYLVVIEYTQWEGYDGCWFQSEAFDSLEDASNLVTTINHDYDVWKNDEFQSSWGDEPDFVYGEGNLYGYWENFKEVAVYQKM